MSDEHKTQVLPVLDDDGERASACLVVVQGDEFGSQLVLRGDHSVLGRSQEADFCLSAPGVSRRHCRVSRRDGEHWIEDLGSTNHTLVNEEVVETRRLRDGDRIRLGQTVLRFLSAADGSARADADGGPYERQAFMAHLEAAVDRVGASPDEPAGGVLYVQLDDVADLRDRIGLGGLDTLLEDIAGHLAEQLVTDYRPARFGEHSLALLALDLDEDGLHRLADKLVEQVSSKAFEVGEDEVAVTVSVGLCPLSLRLSDADATMVCAARAADQASEGGGNRAEVYEPVISAAGADEDDRTMLGLLREALASNSIQTLFQPAVSAGADEITHYQLLPRLHTDDDMLVPASKFLPVAERHGEVRAIDRWMSVRALSVIRDQLGQGRKVRLFISQSADSLADGERFESLARQLEPAIIDHRLLVLEFRHDDVMDHLRTARELLPRLNALGYGLSISRIGDEPGPDRLLSHFQPQYCKLAREFSERIARDATAAKQYEEVAGRIRQAGAKVIISHVEDAETMSRLWHFGADLLQGNFIQKPTQTPDFNLDD